MILWLFLLWVAPCSGKEIGVTIAFRDVTRFLELCSQLLLGISNLISWWIPKRTGPERTIISGSGVSLEEWKVSHPIREDDNSSEFSFGSLTFSESSPQDSKAVHPRQTLLSLNSGVSTDFVLHLRKRAPWVSPTSVWQQKCLSRICCY